MNWADMAWFAAGSLVMLIAVVAWLVHTLRGMWHDS